MSVTEVGWVVAMVMVGIRWGISLATPTEVFVWIVLGAVSAVMFVATVGVFTDGGRPMSPPPRLEAQAAAETAGKESAA